MSNARMHWEHPFGRKDSAAQAAATRITTCLRAPLKIHISSQHCIVYKKYFLTYQLYAASTFFIRAWSCLKLWIFRGALKAGKHKNFQCRCCRLQTSLIAGTLFQRTYLSLSDWFLAIYLISQVRIGLAARQAGTPRTRYLLWRPFLSVPKAVSCILNGTGTWLYAQSDF